MSTEFATMLKDKLEKMQEKINLAHAQWDKENETNMMKKLDEFSIIEKK